MANQYRIGLDIGSTTIKCVVLDEHDSILYSCYERHYSLITQKTREFLTRLNQEFIHDEPVCISISGSAGMGLALGARLSFVQEVYATKVAADTLMPGTDWGRVTARRFFPSTKSRRQASSPTGGERPDKRKRRPGRSPSRRTWTLFSAMPRFGYFSGGMRSTWPS